MPRVKTKVRIQDVITKEDRDETATRLDTRVDLARSYRDLGLGGGKDTSQRIEGHYWQSINGGTFQINCLNFTEATDGIR